MPGTFDNVDLSLLPKPDAIIVWSYQGIVDARIQTFAANWKAQQAQNPKLPDYNVGALQTDPSVMLQQTGGYREGLVLQDINEAILATYLAFADGNDLVARAGDYSTAKKAGETDDSLRQSAQLAWENLSLGGTYGGYTYRAKRVAPTEIAGVLVYGHEIAAVPKGEVWIIVMAAGANPTPSTALLARVQGAFPRHGRKVNDRIFAKAANVLPYTIDATLQVKSGDAATVVAAQKKAVTAFAAARQTITGQVTPDLVRGTLVTNSPDVVVNCALRQPLAPIGGGPFDVPWCTGIRVVAGPVT